MENIYFAYKILAVKTQAVERCRIQLPNRTPHMWYNSDLRKLISEYVNPKRKYGACCNNRVCICAYVQATCVYSIMLFNYMRIYRSEKILDRKE